MPFRSSGRFFRSTGSTRLLGTRYAVALAVLVALTLSSFLFMRSFVVDERALDNTMNAIGELRVELATQRITMRDLVDELRSPTPDEVRLRGFRRALIASRERLVGDRGRLRRSMESAGLAQTTWAILLGPPYSLDRIIDDMSADVRIALQDQMLTDDEEIAVIADPREDCFLTITDSHATAARLAADRLLDELRAETEARKVRRERIHAWLGWTTVLVLFGEAIVIFWPLLGRLGREARRADEAVGELTRLARYDALTGLLNRASLIGEIEEELAGADPRSDRAAVLLIDLDRFKPINDTFGHAAGDGVLIEVARRLQASVRPRDVVARLGGDEFVILLRGNAGADMVREVGRRIEQGLGRDMEIEGHRLQIGASIGCALWPRDGHDVDGLLSAADLAMSRAKRSDHDDLVFFDEDLRSDVARVRSEEADLRRAIDEKRLALRFRPITSIDGTRLEGLEATVWWDHPSLGLLAPERFQATAVRAGLMGRITAELIDGACRRHAAWRAAGLEPGLLSVDVSAALLSQPNLVRQILETAARHGVAPASLALTVAERVIGGGEGASIVAQIEAAHRDGLRVALDGFGLGASSLELLRRPCIDMLKVDPVFVRDLGASPENATLLGATLELGRILGKQIVIEGTDRAERALPSGACEQAWVVGGGAESTLDAAAATALMAAGGGEVRGLRRAG